MQIGIEMTLSELKKLAEAAVDGVWKPTEKGTVLVPGKMVISIVMNGYTFSETMDQAKFIAASRQAVPDLIARLESAERKLKYYAGYHDVLGDNAREHFKTWGEV